MKTNCIEKTEEMDDFEKTYRQFEIEWSEYLKYLKKWADEHSGVEYYGMTPACFDEWRENEAD